MNFFTMNDLVDSAPLISSQLMGLKEMISLFLMTIILGLIISLCIRLYGYLKDYYTKRRNVPWLPVMRAQSDKRLARDLWKIYQPGRLPTSYRGIKATTIEERSWMVEDFIKICRKRNIKAKR